MIKEYYDGKDVLTLAHGTDDYIRLSPSSLADFFDHTNRWYRENILGEKKEFQGNTGSVTGSLIHASLEALTSNQPDITKEDASDYIDKQLVNSPELDKQLIQSLWQPMASVLHNAVKDDTVLAIEEFVYAEIIPGIFAGGSVDVRIVDKGLGGQRVRDYKSATTKPSSFNRKYRMQQQIYCYLLTLQGHPITSYELSFVTQATKTLPIRTFSFVEPYNKEVHQYIGEVLLLVAESVKMFLDNPDMRHLLAQDMRLKSKPEPTSFPS